MAAKAVKGVIQHPCVPFREEGDRGRRCERGRRGRERLGEDAGLEGGPEGQQGVRRVMPDSLLYVPSRGALPSATAGCGDRGGREGA